MIIDLGLDKIVAEMDELKGVKVGLLESSGTYEDGTSVVDVGVWNEYGAEKAPARPFMQGTINQYGKQLQEYADNLVGQLVDGELDAPTVDAAIGAKWAGNIKSVIELFHTPANRPSTIRKKGRDDPLVDTGRMKSAINWERL